jgi:carboxymethylenebutenolidase
VCDEGDYDGPGGRRIFLKRGLALGALGLAGPRAWAADAAPRFAGKEVAFPSRVGRVKGYLARPSRPGRHPAVVVLHTTRFSQPDTYRIIADDLARSGFVALSVARYSRIPDFSQEMLDADEKGPQRLRGDAFFREEMDEARGAIEWLARQRFVEGEKIGAVGFCGGAIKAIRMSTDTPRLGAIISFYGAPRLPARFKKASDPLPDLVDLGARVRSPLQMHYGTADYVVKAPDVEELAALVRKAGMPVEVYAYEGAGHGFYEADNPNAYKAEAAALARDRALRFLHEHLC